MVLRPLQYVTKKLFEYIIITANHHLDLWPSWQALCVHHPFDHLASGDLNAELYYDRAGQRLENYLWADGNGHRQGVGHCAEV